MMSRSSARWLLGRASEPIDSSYRPETGLCVSARQVSALATDRETKWLWFGKQRRRTGRTASRDLAYAGTE